MKLINVHEAKTNLSRLLEEVEHGGEVIIGRAGRPVAVLKAFQPARRPRKPGMWKGRVKIAPDFDELPRELQAAFAGRAE